ncbi:hypothetical protein DdX_18664 [Ditylenchus destructor]|uniref:Uncharacterized protein n=1 Tax=Ditylenchus destructor TaxID=166010 RepID=A0AAD4QXX9_9BILA|nr:hypothetical protein DdX_18664 [Ditylenchus destructor]
MDDLVTGIQPTAPPENGTNKPAEQNIASDEYEDTSPKLDSRMSDALDDPDYLEQALRMLNENDGKIEKQFCQIFPTSSPFSFEKNVSEMHKYLEKVLFL